MSTTGARASSTTRGSHWTDRYTPAQWYCLAAGAALLAAGVFGFIADATFDTASDLDGDSFLGFEVNGWHNLVHLLSGLFLLAMHKRRDTAKTAAIGFGVVYGIVTVIGMVDGTDVLGILPVNPADNVLHLLLSLAGIVMGAVSRADHGIHGERTVPHTKADQAGRGDLGEREGRVVAPGEEVRGRTRPRI